MAIVRPFAYNPPPNQPISGTTQVGTLAVGYIDVEYSTNYGGVTWWEGPDELLGYVICNPVSGGTQPNPISIPAYVGFKRSKFLTEPSFISIANYVAAGRTSPFTTGNDASTWLTNNGYWNSWTCYPQSGLKLYIDASNPQSYPTTGNTWFNLYGPQNVTLQNNPSFSTDNGGLIYFNQSLSQYGSYPNLGRLSAFTVSVWYNMKTLPPAGTYFPALVTDSISSLNINYVIGSTIFGNNQLMAGGFHDGTWRTTAGFPIVANEWVYVTLTYDGNELKLYKNDTLYSSNVIGVPAQTDGGVGYINRRWDYPDYYDVDIPVVQIYDRELPLLEIQKNYNCFHGRFIDLPTPTPTVTQTQTPTPTPTEPFFILAQNGDILTAQDGSGIEYQH
jgi:hypothetical protein